MLETAEGRSAHQDTFARDHLPDRALWPVMDYSTLAELNYPEHLNCASELLDATSMRAGAGRPALHFPGGSWTYGDLAAPSG